MPIHHSIKNHYFQWGHHGKKYYYKANSKQSKDEAMRKVLKQARAIIVSQLRNQKHRN